MNYWISITKVIGFTISGKKLNIGYLIDYYRQKKTYRA